VFAGTINESGFIEIKATKIGKDTTIERIIEMVEESEKNKAKVQRVADRFSAYFTPIVLLISIATYIITKDIIQAITVIVVACPCAVALATPIAIAAGIGKGSKRDVLIKGGVYLEALGKSNIVVFDKTGTLTLGKPQVTDLI